jgi:hypothetical protein
MSKTTKRVADAIKPALASSLSANAYGALIALPGIGWFFALPVISQITKTFLDRIAQWAVQETAVGLSLLWIQVDLAYEIASAEQAKNRLKDMLENPQKYGEKEQRKIDEYFDETTVDLIQLGIDRLA